ncbi:MAG: hypothetical protein NTW28_30635 [Candidatus Solibacter sp.]|nr:hypothetical protein [Candidatus Solibacter sp.]
MTDTIAVDVWCPGLGRPHAAGARTETHGRELPGDVMATAEPGIVPICTCGLRHTFAAQGCSVIISKDGRYWMPVQIMFTLDHPSATAGDRYRS